METKTEEPKKLGRPPRHIDWETFEGLCRINCTHAEVASVLNISKAQLYERAKKHYGEDFPTIYKRYSEAGKASLRRAQFKLAQKNAAMAIWLGKQYLGQRDEHREAETEAHKFVIALKQLIDNEGYGKKPTETEDKKQ